MKRMKKYLALGLAGLLAMSLTACGGSGNSNSEPAAAPAAETPAAEADEGKEASEAPAAEDGEKAPAAASGETYNITWVSCSTESDFWQYQQIGMENAAADMEAEHGITINFTAVGPAQEAETEAYIRAFENAIASKPDAIISATLVPDSTWTLSKDATDQGIVVNFTNCGLEGMDSTEHADCYNQFYTTSNGDIGDMAGKIMLQLLDEAGMAKEGVIAMEYSVVNETLQPRMDHFKEYVEANSDIEVLDTQYNNNDLARAQSDIENLISTYGDKLIGIYGGNNISGDGIALAVENAGNADKVITIGVDSDQTEIQALEAGTIDCIIVQDAYGQGYAALKNAVETMMQGKNPEAEQKVAMLPVAVTTANMHEDEYAAMLDPTLLKK